MALREVAAWSFLAGGGETGQLIASLDWSRTALGPLDRWPSSLKTATAILLRSPVPIVMLWGEEGVMLYNDAYSAFAGGRHPELLGSKVREGWPEVADFNDNVMRVGLSGGTLHYKDQELTLYRHGHGEQVWMNLDYSPVPGEDGRPAGVICILSETTEQVAAEARLAAEAAALARLNGLSSRLWRLASLPDGLEEMLGATIDMLGADMGNIQLLDADANLLRIVVQRGFGPEFLDAFREVSTQDECACGRTLRSGERTLIEDVEHDAAYAPFVSLARGAGYRAVQSTPLIARDGSPLGMISTHWSSPHRPSDHDLRLLDLYARQAADFIERGKLETALRASEERFRTALTIETVGAIYFDMDGRLTDANDAFLGMSGYSRAELDAGELTWQSLTPPEHMESSKRAFAELRERGVTTPYEKEYIRKDGSRWCALFAAKMLPDGTGFEFVLDITDRKRAEAGLRDLNATLEARVAEQVAERNMLATIVEATDVMIMACDLDYRILAINKANADEFERIYGVRPRVGDNMLGLLADQPTHREQVRVGWGRGLTGEDVTMVEAYGDPARTRPYYEVKFRPLRNDRGELVGTYQFVSDVTQRLREQAQLAEAQEALRQSQKMEAMGSLTGGVAHDFNNLLTPIVGALDMLQRKGLGGEREQRLIDGAAQSAERARVLVQRLLAFARRQPLQPVAVDVGRLVTEMADLVSSTTGPQTAVVVNVPGDLPPAKADPNQLEMALLNLAVNARDAMPDGGTLSISASAERVRNDARSVLQPGRYVRLSVVDTGVGMDEATIARAVEPFFSTKGVGKGTGLGLSMVHGLASQLGGALLIRSQPGRGTEMELWLPQTEDVPEALAPVPEAQASRGQGTALLVDDEEFVRLSTADMLSDLGYQVVEAASAEEALRVLGSGADPDVLVTDHLMPGMTGTELARLMREQRPHLPVLVVSGYAEVDGVASDLPRLTKPFRKDELAMSLAGLPSARVNSGGEQVTASGHG